MDAIESRYNFWVTNWTGIPHTETVTMFWLQVQFDFEGCDRVSNQWIPEFNSWWSQSNHATLTPVQGMMMMIAMVNIDVKFWLQCILHILAAFNLLIYFTNFSYLDLNNDFIIYKKISFFSHSIWIITALDCVYWLFLDSCLLEFSKNGGIQSHTLLSNSGWSKICIVKLGL